MTAAQEVYSQPFVSLGFILHSEPTMDQKIFGNIYVHGVYRLLMTFLQS